jgi:alkylated DNA repair dioxygenase AlkB
MTEHTGQRQRTLFDDFEERRGSTESHTTIEGLQYVTDFVTAEQHDRLLRDIDANEWRSDLRRRVQHYGFRYDYKSRSVDYSMRIGELPPWAAELAGRLLSEQHFPERPDQVIVNEYDAS